MEKQLLTKVLPNFFLTLKLFSSLFSRKLFHSPPGGGRPDQNIYLWFYLRSIIMVKVPNFVLAPISESLNVDNYDSEKCKNIVSF